MLDRLSTPTGTGRTTSRYRCSRQSFLLIGIPRNAPGECVRYNREMVGITRVACRSQLLSRRLGTNVVDYSCIPGDSERSLLARERKEVGKKRRSEKE
jgi:hypothetical protein